MHTQRHSWKPFQCHHFKIKANKNRESLQLIRTTVGEAIRHTLFQCILIRIVAPELKGGGPRYKGSACEEVYVDLMVRKVYTTDVVSRIARIHRTSACIFSKCDPFKLFILFLSCTGSSNRRFEEFVRCQHENIPISTYQVPCGGFECSTAWSTPSSLTASCSKLETNSFRLGSNKK